MGVQHDTHQRGAAPGEAADEDEGRVLWEVLGERQAVVGRAQVELHPAVAVALGRAVQATHAQVEQRDGAEEHAAQQEAGLGVPHGCCLGPPSLTTFAEEEGPGVCDVM